MSSADLHSDSVHVDGVDGNENGIFFTSEFVFNEGGNNRKSETLWFDSNNGSLSAHNPSKLTDSHSQEVTRSASMVEFGVTQRAFHQKIRK